MQGLESAGLVVDVDQHRPQHDDVGALVPHRRQVGQGRLDGAPTPVAVAGLVQQAGALLEQVCGHVAEHDPPGGPHQVQCAEAQQAVAAAHVQNDVTGLQGRAGEHRVPDRGQEPQHPVTQLRVTPETLLQDPVRPPVLGRPVRAAGRLHRHSMTIRASVPPPGAPAVIVVAWNRGTRQRGAGMHSFGGH